MGDEGDMAMGRSVPRADERVGNDGNTGGIEMVVGRQDRNVTLTVSRKSIPIVH